MNNKHRQSPARHSTDKKKTPSHSQKPVHAQRRPTEQKKFPMGHAVEGPIRVTANGVGYVEVEGMKEDIEIEGENLNTALDRDRVKIVLYGKSANARQGGEVTEILFRNKTKFVCVIEMNGGSYFLRPDDFKMYRAILIPKEMLHRSEEHTSELQSQFHLV